MGPVPSRMNSGGPLSKTTWRRSGGRYRIKSRSSATFTGRFWIILNGRRGLPPGLDWWRWIITQENGGFGRAANGMERSVPLERSLFTLDIFLKRDHKNVKGSPPKA